ncbi:MscS Mechanosensitive ion channel [Sulfurimonas autotrophica DSM 16294]|uniref:MscS Mechanosensitive ion channel n=2 Tax=Sulfurimonas autotrophica TaxID=202747 RepID=E0UUS3_SULAO|nr:MscS Mechanosensitive ion channel [Sulfurimonas autotrophica DSM 16294]
MKNFKIILVFVLFAFGVTLNAKVKYSKFIDTQLQLVYQMNDANLSQEQIEDLVQKQEYLYDQELNKIISNKQYYIENVQDYSTEIFSLKKIISINKRAGNGYAVIRDEVQLKSYAIVKNQNILIKNVLLSLDVPTINDFEEKLNIYTAQNQEALSKITTKDYKDILALQDDSSILKATKQNIREYYALQEINSDFIAFLYKAENKLYRLNKYSKYHIIKPVVFIDSFTSVKTVDRLLEPYGLSVVKLIIIFLLILVIYFLRKVFYIALQKLFLKIDFLSRYSEQILEKLRKSIEVLILIINVNMVIYVYNNFSSIEEVSRIFNIIYGFYFTLIIYIIVNTAAVIKLNTFEKEKSNIKSELINVGLKIINFFIVIIGLLIVLYFAGVDLTAVLSGLGIGGFAVAFAAKDTISNFFGTLSVLFSDVFSQGDWIEVDGKEGVVVEIGLRVTTLRTFDNALIAIPNGIFASKDIKNWNKRKLGRRIKMTLGIKYDSKQADIKNAIKEIKEMLQNHPQIATKDTMYEYKIEYGHMAKLVSKDDLEGIKKTLLVYLDEFGDSSINILIYCFSKSVDWEEWLKTKQDVMEKIMIIFENNSLEFAFPSLSIYNETESGKEKI